MRENRRNLDAAYAHKKQNKEYKLDFNETIKAIADLLEECYGVTFYELCRETTMSKLAHREVKPEDVAWRRMLESREDLRKYVAKVVDTGELYTPPTSKELEQMSKDAMMDDDDDFVSAVAAAPPMPPELDTDSDEGDYSSGLSLSPDPSLTLSLSLSLSLCLSLSLSPTLSLCLSLCLSTHSI